MGACCSASGASTAIVVPRLSSPPPRLLSKKNVEQPSPATFRRCHRAPLRCFYDDYKLVRNKVLGKGAAGEVCLAIGRHNHQRVAVKTFDLRNASWEAVKNHEQETSVFLSLDHPHIVRLVDVYISAEEIDLVMECMSGGELFGRMQKQSRFSEMDAARVVRQILLVLVYLHRHNIAHCDLKLENLLYEAENCDHLKICDFGCSQVCKPDGTLSTVTGTLQYTAPEVLKASYTPQCDLWSTGVIAYTLLVGRLPYTGNPENCRAGILRGRWSPDETARSHLSGDALLFLEQLMAVDAWLRPSAKQAPDDQWLLKAERGGSLVDPTVVGSILAFARSSPLRRVGLAAAAWSLTAEESSRVRDTFMAMNTSMSGTLDLAELRAALEGVSDKASIEEIFDALRVTGYSEVCYSDFLAAMCASKISLRKDFVKETFACFDHDHSGIITQQSLKQLCEISYELCPALAECADHFAGHRRMSERSFAKCLLHGGSGEILPAPRGTAWT